MMEGLLKMRMEGLLKMRIEEHALLGLLIRIGLIIYGEWQDRTMAVKFTDIDYFVFNDAAAYVTQVI